MPSELFEDDVTFAVLNEENVPVLCDPKTFDEWLLQNHDRCLVRQDELDGYAVATCFQGTCFLQDGPPLFWKILMYPTEPDDEAHPRRPRQQLSGTFEDALSIHQHFVDLIRLRFV